jgi:hypothetical protein
MKTGLIYQPCGLGDILFLQKAAHYMQEELDYKVYWPVIHEFKWLSDYIPYFEFVSWGDDDQKITGPPLPESCQFPYYSWLRRQSITFLSPLNFLIQW